MLSLLTIADGHEHARQKANYEDIGECIRILADWAENEGKYERFEGEFHSFFALHDKPVLVDLKQQLILMMKFFACTAQANPQKS